MSRKIVISPAENDIKINKWKVRAGSQISNGNIILLYEEVKDAGSKDIKRLKSTNCGIVKKLLFKEGTIVSKG
jgi:hypothetical protein